MKFLCGIVEFRNGRGITIRNPEFDCEGEPIPNNEQIVAAIRDRFLEELAQYGIPDYKEHVTSQVSPSVEREAEMETRLLITRCQDKG